MFSKLFIPHHPYAPIMLPSSFGDEERLVFNEKLYNTTTETQIQLLTNKFCIQNTLKWYSLTMLVISFISFIWDPFGLTRLPSKTKISWLSVVIHSPAFIYLQVHSQAVKNHLLCEIITDESIKKTPEASFDAAIQNLSPLQVQAYGHTIELLTSQNEEPISKAKTTLLARRLLALHSCHLLVDPN
ncbi:MAG: hypothetical protein ACOVOR_01805 [Rhabdochlamydiaceae bacterium]